MFILYFELYLYKNEFSKEEQINDLIWSIRALSDFCTKSNFSDISELNAKTSEVDEFIKKTRNMKDLFHEKDYHDNDNQHELIMLIEKHCENPKDLYNLIIYHLGIDQMIKEINNQCNEQGEVSLKFWKGYQNQIYEIISK